MKMGYWTTFDVSLEFEVINKEPIEVAIQYFMDCINNKASYIERDGKLIRMQFNDSWKNQNSFFEDILLTIENNSTVLACDISANGEEITDRNKWYLGEEGIMIAPVQNSNQKKYTEELFKEIYQDLYSVGYVIRELTNNSESDVQTNDIEEYIENSDFTSFLNYLRESFDGNYQLVIDSYNEESYKIVCENGKEKYFILEELTHYDESKTLLETFTAFKKINQYYSSGIGGTSLFPNDYLSEVDFTSVKVRFEGESGFKYPFHPLFLDSFHWTKNRGVNYHTVGEKDVSICDLCVNKMKQIVDQCFNCYDAKLIKETVEEVTLIMKK